MAMLGNFPTYVQVSVPPQYPMVGQHYSDNQGNTYTWDGFQWVYTRVGYNNNNYLSANNNIYNTINDYSHIGSDIIVHRKDGTYINLIETLDRIMERLGMIEPDYNLIDQSPALKAAYEEYKTQYQLALAKQHPELKAAIDSYNMIAALVKEEENG